MQKEQGEMKLDRESFIRELCRLMTERLGKEYQTEVSGVRKNNGVMKETLYVKKENSECIPCFYTEELYRSYCEGEATEGLSEHIADIVLNECEKVRHEMKRYMGKEWISEHVFLRLVEREKNKEWLEDAVYIPYLDLAAVVYVLIEDCEDGIKSFLLPKYMWVLFETETPEECFRQLVENTRRLFPDKIWRIENTVTECENGWEAVFRIEEEQGQVLCPDRLYAVSNHRKINGAAVLLYPELLEGLYERFSGNYYVIPSSVHEVLLLKDTGNEEEYLNRMVSEVNEKHVEPEDVLSGHVYYYSGEKGLCKSRTDSREK